MAKDIAIEIFGVITGTAPGAGAALTKAIGPDAAKQIMQAVAAIREGVKAALSFISESVIPSVTRAVSFLRENWDVAGPAIAAVALSVIVPAMTLWAASAVAAAAATIVALAPVLIPIAAIGLAVAGLAYAWRENFGDIRGKVEAVIGFVTGTFELFEREGLGGLLRAVGEFAVSVIHKFGEIGRGIVTGILEGLGGLKDAIWNALRAAFESIDFWVGPFHVSGTSGISFSMPQINLPPFVGSFAEGGRVPATGLAMVHKNEFISRADDSGGGSGGYVNHIHLEVDGRELALVIDAHSATRAFATAPRASRCPRETRRDSQPGRSKPHRDPRERLSRGL